MNAEQSATASGARQSPQAPALRRTVAGLQRRDVVTVSGPEAQAYLHGQVSAEVNGLAPGESTLSLLLAPRGNVEALFWLCRTGPETFAADIETGCGAALAASLERFKLRTRAEIAVTQWWMCWLRSPLPADTADAGTASVDAAVADITVHAAAAAVPEAGSAQGRAAVVRDPCWPGANGVDLLGPDADRLVVDGVVALPGHAGVADAETADLARHEALRIAYGLPVMGREIAVGDIPNETGLIERAASFAKGCYRGQELVERIAARTGARRTIVRLTAERPLPVGAALRTDHGVEVGSVLSTAMLDSVGVGFAKMRTSGLADEGTVLCDLADGATIPVEVRHLF